MRRAICLMLLALVLCAPAVAHAEESKNRGLYVDPVREYVQVAAGSAQTEDFAVANLTDQPMTVTFSVQAFSVTDYAYDYEFSPPQDNWVALGLTEVKLQPNQNKKVDYTISIPADAPSGGKYFTLLATTRQDSGSVNTVVRAAALVYLTVQGPLNQNSELKGAHMPRVVFGQHIPFSLDLKNTGNVHYFAHIKAGLSGMPGTNHSILSASHLLMPGTSRQLGGNIPAPFWPGLYKVHYGYQLDSGASNYRTRLIVYLPPWSIAFAILVIAVGYILLRKLVRRRQRIRARANRDH